MRQRPALNGFAGLLSQRAQWLCLIADKLLGRSNLDQFDVLTTGYASVYDHPYLGRARLALWNLRQLGIDVSQRRGVRRAVNDCLEWVAEHEGEDGYFELPYTIENRLPYPFRCNLADDDPVIVEMLNAVTGPLDYVRQNYKDPDLARPVFFTPPGSGELAEVITVDLSELPELSAPSFHDLTRRPRGPVRFSLVDLVAIAEELDGIDALHPTRRPGNWRNRLIDPLSGEWKFDALAPVSGALTAQDEIRLEGLRHMIGLPGSGKTTLIMLILVWMSRNDYRVAVLLPSIETSLNMLSDLRFYGADVGLLVGQTPGTRIRHANRLAERLATIGQNQGYGTTMYGADLLGINCPLEAYRCGPNLEYPPFPHTEPPCTAMRQTTLKQDGTQGAQAPYLRCPVASWCGRMRAPRKISQHSIWLGHIHSADTNVQPHFLDEQERIRHFEVIARTMDLVIVDEADGAQKSLDERSVVSLDITGSRESMESKIQDEFVSPILAGRNYHTGSSVTNYLYAVNRFRMFNAYVTRLLQLDYKQHREHGLLVQTYSGRFITGNTVLGMLFMPENFIDMSETARELEEDRIDRIREFWDDAVRRGQEEAEAGRDEPEMDAARVAEHIGRTEEEVEDAAQEIAAGLRLWLNSDEVGRKGEFEERVRNTLFQLMPPADHLGQAAANQHFSMLFGVTLVANQFRLLSMAQRSMVAEGIHREPLSGNGSSQDLVRLMPEAVIGRFSGVRVSFEGEEGEPKQLRLQYLSFTGSPRILLYRWHELFSREGQELGPNVLLTSATSFLEESPSYHIPVDPDLVLKARGGVEEWRCSEWRLLPIPDPSERGRLLRFSGSTLSKRETILQRMIDYFYDGEAPRVETFLEDFDPDRKTAFVVNSYEQVRQIKAYLKQRYPALGARTIGVIDKMPNDAGTDWVVASQVELIGGRDDWDAIVFPMKSLSRGVNIVFPDGPRRNDAVIGTVVFLTRPHPAADNLDLVTGVVGRGTLELDRQVINPAGDLRDINRAWIAKRRDVMATVRRLLRFPIIASMLGPYMEPFTADVMVDVLQTIGRAMRNGKKARVLFVDSAWAPRSFVVDGDKDDTPTTSMLVAIRSILRKRVNAPNPVERGVYRALYEPFLHPLERCEHLREDSKKAAAE